MVSHPNDRPPSPGAPAEAEHGLEARNFGKPGAYVAALLTLGLALHEVSFLASGFLTEDGKHSSFNSLSAPFFLRDADRWRDALTTEQLVPWQHLQWLYLGLDGAFIFVYTAALLALAKWATRAEKWSSWRRWVRGPVLALAAADVLEVLGQLWIGTARCAHETNSCVPSVLVSAVSLVTDVKWLLITVLVGLGMFALVRNLRRAAQVAWAIWIQRFSLLAFLPVAVLAVVPGAQVINNLFDQLPDVQRAWLDDWKGLRHWAAASVAYVTVVYLLFFLGRIRTDWAARRESGGYWWPSYDSQATFDEAERSPRSKEARKVGARPQDLTFWLVPPLMLVVVAGVTDLVSGSVHWWRLWAFCALPWVVGLLSLLVVLGGRPKPRRLRRVDTVHPRWLARDVMAAGDILAVAALSLAGIGMVRAFTGEVALLWVGLMEGEYMVWPWLALAVGVALAVAPWPMSTAILEASRKPEALASPLTGRLASRRPQASDPGTGMVFRPGEGPADAASNGADELDDRRRFMLGLLLLSIIGFLVLCVWPRFWADKMGALALSTAALGTLMVMLGVLFSFAQDRQPPEILQPLGFKTTPIITMLVISALAADWVGGRADIHAVGGSGPIPERPTMEAAFASWLAQDDPCAMPYESGSESGSESGGSPAKLTVRPMLMLAAEGGGIRATYWTAAALQRIGAAGADGCGRRAALFSAGASGGALGLTLGRFDDNPLAVADAMRGPDALSVGSVQLMAGDLLASATGIRFVENSPHRTPDKQGLDRAGLMETSWEREPELANLRTPFLPADLDDATRDDGAVTGQLILTSTTARDGCRTLVSQVDLGGNKSFGDRWPGCGVGLAGEDSYDLFTAYGKSSEGEGEGEQCLPNVAALTAGMLASRFPYVTPSAVVGGCRGLDGSQLIDGGYTDNFGLGTIIDLAPLWQPLVSAHNDAVLASGSGQLIVPMVAFLDNGAGGDYSASPEAEEGSTPDPGASDWWKKEWSIPETLVPPIGFHNGRDHKISAEAGLLESRGVASEALCTEGTPGCAELKESARTNLQVFVVHQRSQPSIPAALGWVLSDTSRADMCDDMDYQATTGSRVQSNDPASEYGYGSLHDLLLTLGDEAGASGDC